MFQHVRLLLPGRFFVVCQERSQKPVWPHLLGSARFLASSPQSRAPEGNAAEEGTSPRYERAQTGPASVLRSIVQARGPLTTKETWKYAQEAGLQSRSQMKKALKWLKERKQIECLCVFPPDKKTTVSTEGEFFYRVPKKMQSKQEAKEEISQLVKERRSESSMEDL
eukprot:TRINITY_DN17884_c0_g1_i1.p1 TRINITY_DN17884_c0_g1~~TRINITY_DN17884_c0_g1_i1.p1  ORF type:complete len:167 (-),score=10.02 TRINITY_DN17884_c0_g1_i1:185-685(-)